MIGPLTADSFDGITSCKYYYKNVNLDRDFLLQFDVLPQVFDTTGAG